MRLKKLEIPRFRGVFVRDNLPLEPQRMECGILNLDDTAGNGTREEIKGSFYEQELQKTTREMFRIEKVIRRKGGKSLVKWLGYHFFKYLFKIISVEVLVMPNEPLTNVEIMDAVKKTRNTSISWCVRTR